jgi:hypothetical protein
MSVQKKSLISAPKSSEKATGKSGVKGTKITSLKVFKGSQVNLKGRK